MRLILSLLLTILFSSIIYSQERTSFTEFDPWVKNDEEGVYPIYNIDGSVTFSPLQVNYLRNIYNARLSDLNKIAILNEINNHRIVSDSLLKFQIKELQIQKSNLLSQISNLEKVRTNNLRLRASYDDHINLSRDTAKKLNKDLKRARLKNIILGVSIPVAAVVTVLVIDAIKK